MKIRDILKLIETDGWQLVRQAGTIGNLSIRRSQER
jgi:hypothetical protein